MTIIGPAHSKSCSSTCGKKLVQKDFSHTLEAWERHIQPIIKYETHTNPLCPVLSLLFFYPISGETVPKLAVPLQRVGMVPHCTHMVKLPLLILL